MDKIFRNLNLEQSISKNIDDINFFKNYIEWLREERDSRAEWMMKQVEADLSEDEEAKEKAVEAGNEYIKKKYPDCPVDVIWRWGFIDVIEVYYNKNEDFSILNDSLCCFIRTLELYYEEDEDINLLKDVNKNFLFFK